MKALAVVAALAVTAALALQLLDTHIDALDERVDRLEQPAPVVRSQGGGSSRPTSTTSTTEGPHVDLKVDGHCVETGQREAAAIGAAPDPACAAKP